MPSATPNEQQVLLRYLKGQREHIFEALEGLDVDDLRRQVLPSRWTCVGLVNHLFLDVERFWFQALLEGADARLRCGGRPGWRLGSPASPGRRLYRGPGQVALN